MKTAALRSPFLWVGLLLLAALIGALVFSDSVADLARYSAEYQRRIQQVLSGSLRDIKSGTGSFALWTLATVCFGYGVVHTLGPGHGKAVVVAYFLDSSKPRAARGPLDIEPAARDFGFRAQVGHGEGVRRLIEAAR